MQGPRNSSCEVPVVDHIGFEFEHEQQNHPCGRVNAGCESLDDVGQDYSISKAVRLRLPFHGEEQVDIKCEQCIDRILE